MANPFTVTPGFTYDNPNREAYDKINAYFFEQPTALERFGIDPKKNLIISGPAHSGKTECCNIVSRRFEELIAIHEEDPIRGNMLKDINHYDHHDGNPLNEAYWVWMTKGYSLKKILLYKMSERIHVFNEMVLKRETVTKQMNFDTPAKYWLDDVFADLDPTFSGQKKRWSEQLIRHRCEWDKPILATTRFSLHQLRGLEGFDSRVLEYLTERFNWITLTPHWSKDFGRAFTPSATLI